MLVILKAFGDRLFSDVMEFPDNIGDTIYLPVDKPCISMESIEKEREIPVMPVHRCKFIFEGRWTRDIKGRVKVYRFDSII